MGSVYGIWPYKPFRGITLYLPGHENIAYFKRLIRNVMALYTQGRMRDSHLASGGQITC